MAIYSMQVSKAESEARIMTKYKDLIEQGKQQFQKELESIVPEVKMGIKKGKKKVIIGALVYLNINHMSRLMIKPTICICENKDTDQLRGNREADQRLCFRYKDSTLPLLLKSEISSF